MLRTLLESQAHPSRRAGGTVISIGVHTALIALAIAATARATVAPIVDRPKASDITYKVATPPPNDPQNNASVTTRSGTTIIPAPERVIVPPLHVPTGLPTIDGMRPVVGEISFGGGGSLAGRSGDGLASPAGGIFTSNLVDKAVLPQPGNPAPIYPSTLRSAQVEGEVVARFIVDSVGRVEPPSISFASATHPLFADAVRQSLLRSRYLPAVAAGRNVRQLVEQRFAFTLTR